MAFRDSNQAARVAHQRWAKVTDRSEATRPGREAALAKLEAEVDPDGVMSPRDRRRAARNAQAAHMLLMSERGNAARRRKRSPREAGEAGE